MFRQDQWLAKFSVSSPLSVTCDLCGRNFDLEDIRVHLQSVHPDPHKGYTVIQQVPIYTHLQPPRQPIPTIKSQKVINSSKNLLNQPQGSYFGSSQNPPRVGQSFQTYINNVPYHYYDEASYIHATSFDPGKGENMIITKPQHPEYKSDIEFASNVRVDSMHNSRQRKGQYMIDNSFKSNYIVDVKTNHQKSISSRKLVTKPKVEPQEFQLMKDQVQEEPFKIYLNRETLNFRKREAGSRVINMNQKGGKKNIQAAVPSKQVQLKKSKVGYQKKPINYQYAKINQKQYVEKLPHLSTSFIDQDQMKKQPNFFRVNRSRTLKDSVHYQEKVLYINNGIQVQKQIQPQRLPEYRFEPNKSNIKYQKQPPNKRIMYINQSDRVNQQPQQEIKPDADKKVIKLSSSKAQYISEKENMKSINVNQDQMKQKMEKQTPPTNQIKLSYSQIQYQGDIYFNQLTLNEKQKINELEFRPERKIQINKSRIYYDIENPEKKQIFLNLYQESEKINLPEYQYHYQKEEEYHPIRNFSPIKYQQKNLQNSYILQSNVVIKEKKDLSAKQKHVVFNQIIQKPYLKPNRACEWIEQSKRDKTKKKLIFGNNLGTSKAETDISKSKMMDGLMMRIYQLIGKIVSENQAEKCIQAYENRKTNETLDQFILKYF